MHSAKAAELSPLIKEASLRVILKTSCCVLSPHVCKSISEWSGLTLPTPASAWTQPSAPRQSWPCWKNTQVPHWVATKVLYNRLQIVVIKECFSQCFLPDPGVYSHWLSFYWVLELHNALTGQRNLQGGMLDPHQTYGPLSVWFLLGRLAEIEIEL